MNRCGACKGCCIHLLCRLQIINPREPAGKVREHAHIIRLGTQRIYERTSTMHNLLNGVVGGSGEERQIALLEKPILESLDLLTKILMPDCKMFYLDL